MEATVCNPLHGGYWGCGLGSIVRIIWHARLGFSARSMVWQAVQCLLRAHPPPSWTWRVTVPPNGQLMRG